MADATVAEYKNTKINAEALFGREVGTASHIAAVKNIREGLKKNSVEDVITNIKDQGTTPLEARQIKEGVDRIIAFNTDAAGKETRDAHGNKERTGVNENAQQVSEKNLLLANSLLEDYSAIDSRAQSNIRSQVETFIRDNWPDARDILDTTTGPERIAYLENIILNPDFKRVLKGNLEKLTGTDQAAFKLPDNLVQALAQATTELKTKQSELREKEAAVIAAQTKLNEFNAGEPKATEIETTTTNELNYKNQIAANETKSQEMDGRITSLKGKHTNTQRLHWEEVAHPGSTRVTEDMVDDAWRAYMRAQNDKAKLDGETAELKARLERLPKLIEERDNAHAALETAEKERDTKQAEVGKAETAELLTKADLQTAKIEMEHKQGEYVKKTEQIFSESTKGYLEDALKKSDTKRTELLGKAEEKAKTKDEAEFNRLLNERWHKKGKTNKDLVNSDLKALLNADPEAGEEELRSRMRLSDSKWDAIWKDKKDLAIQTLLARRLNMGPLPPTEGWKLFDRYNKELFEAAKQKKKDFNDWMNTAREEGWIKKPGYEGFVEFAREHKGMITVILALLVAGGAQVLAPGWTVAKLAAAGKPIGEKLVTSHFAGTPNPFR